MMKTNDGTQHYGLASLVSVMLTAVAITVNHFYSLGAGALILGSVLLVVPALLLMLFTRTGSSAAFGGYMLVNAWIVIGFGLMKGLWGTTLRVFAGTLLASRSTLFPKPAIGAFGFEISGLLMLIGSLFVFHYALKLLPWNPNGRQRLALATAAGLSAVITVGAYVATDRDV